MTLPSSGTLSIVDIVHEFRSAAFGTIASNPIQQDTYKWFFTVSSSTTINVGDLVFQDSFSTNNLQFGQVLAVGYPGVGVNVSVLWNAGYAPSVGMVLRKLDAAGRPMKLSQYYAGGSWVPAGTVGYPGGVPTNIPSSGQLKISNFYGASRFIQVVKTGTVIGYQYQEIALEPGTWYLYAIGVGAGGGNGGPDQAQLGAAGGVGSSFKVKFELTVTNAADKILIAGGTGGQGGTQGSGSGGGAGGTTPNFATLNGGAGGDAGWNNSSGGGGGGGAGSGIAWFKNGAVVPLAVAAGGGGGGGAGKNTSRFDRTYFAGNWQDRGFTTDATKLNAQTSDGNLATWHSTPQNYRIPYHVTPTMKGQGATNASQYYPPASDTMYNWDGGAGGGAGGPFGLPGGYAESNDYSRTWIRLEYIDKNGSIVYAWQPPFESTGAGGSQGWRFVNSSVITSEVYGDNRLWSTYGAGSVPGTRSFGLDGAVKVRITNVDDGVYPA